MPPCVRNATRFGCAAMILVFLKQNKRNVIYFAVVQFFSFLMNKNFLRTMKMIFFWTTWWPFVFSHSLSASGIPSNGVHHSLEPESLPLMPDSGLMIPDDHKDLMYRPDPVYLTYTVSWVTD